MMNEMKRVKVGRARVVHIETTLGIVNVWVGLSDNKGRAVEHIEVIPNCYAGEPVVVRRGDRLVQLKTRRG